ncbi:SDR family NAD(P)-dependent oxidoreductase [Gordonia phosphorivorans]|uniref:SDR family NAD(P)-dependent oxidoreductase n=1 Tax=Gordonia phosphorivorans TaxID=1056982 RepID=A0ABV6HBF8_9ACTN
MTLPSNTFSGRTVLVTGGTSGIGAATALHFAGLGATVHAVGLGADCVDFPTGINGNDGLDIRVTELDVTNRAAVDAFFATLDRLDVLVPAAGVTLGPPEQEPEGFARVIEINLLAVQYFIVKSAPLLAKNTGASIVNIASMLSIFGSADGPAYSASKGAIVQLTKSMAQVHAPAGIRCNAVAPGWIDTPLLESVKTVAPEVYAALLQRTPLARFGDPVEVARAIGFLASDDASFITGAVLPVDGGFHTV